jgi:PhnB protein
MALRAVPEGHSTITPYLIVTGAANAIEFYKKTFGATELMRLAQPDGKIGHAEIQIGGARIMLADEVLDMGFWSPRSLGGSGTGIVLYVDDVDDVFRRAIAAGARPLQPVKDQPYGDRSGTLSDPFGHMWTIATHVEDVSPAEMQHRMAASAASHAAI